MPMSKVGKIVRTLFDLTLKMDERALNLETVAQLCHFIIKWCEEESRSFLRMRIESKLADILFRQNKFQASLELLKKLIYELKKKEDKQLLVESQLVESKVYHAL